MIVDNNELIQKVEQELKNVQHLMADSELMTWFSDDFALRFCWSSNAIEGNTLSLDETVALVEYDEVRAGHTYSEYRDAKNLYRAIRASLIPFHQEKISEEWIKENNRLLRGEDGEYRRKDNRVGTLVETTYVPPHFEEVPALMRGFVSSVNFEAAAFAELIEQLAKSHLQFERIHPFWDGNGRVGRMILNQQMINHGLLPVALNKNRSYRDSFKRFDRNGDTSLLVHEILKEELQSISRLCEFEKKRQRGFSWDPQMTLEEKIEAAGKLQAEQNTEQPVRNVRKER